MTETNKKVEEVAKVEKEPSSATTYAEASKVKKAMEGKEKVKKSSPKVAKLIEEVEKLTVLELAELVKALEDKFGVSATLNVAAAAVPAPGTTPVAPAEEKTEFNVILAAAGANKIAVIKAVREVKPDLGLKEAKDLVEAAPKELLSGVKKEEAENAKKKLTEAGAQVEIK